MVNCVITELQYDDALERVFHLMQTHPAIGMPEGETLNSLVIAIEQYESIHYPMKTNQ